MAILKKKIAQATKAFEILKTRKREKHVDLPKQIQTSTKNFVDAHNIHNIQKKRRRLQGGSFTPENVRSTKNIVKNFGRAICSFAISHLALPYLEPLLKEKNVKLNDFIAHANQIKENIDLFKFRSLLMYQKEDNREVRAKKEVFQMIGEVFIKYFSVNWIIHGKIQHKEAHMKFRFKMLRRIQKPELFTYLKGKKIEYC